MKKRNILFLFPDQHRKEWMPYKNDVFQQWQMEKPDLKVPNLSKIMEQGVTFLNAMTASPLCAPARACLAAGVRYPQCETFGNNRDYPLDKPTMYSALKNVGYHVLGVGKFDLRKNTCDWYNEENPKKLGFTRSLDNEGKIDAVVHYERNGAPAGPYMQFLEDKGFAKLHFDDLIARGKKTHVTPLTDEVYCDNWVTQNAIDMINDTPIGEPWFMQVNFTGPHDPFDITENMRKTVKDKMFEPAHQGQTEPNELDLRRNYAAMIENIDRNIGKILALVEERGELSNTIIVYSSDHGEMLGDHGKYAKCVPFRGSVGIPLVISMPDGARNGEYETSIVELQDLAATFVELGGTTFADGEDSKSLLPVLADSEITHRELGFSALYTATDKSFKCVVDNQYKYIEYKDGEKVLYDILNNPWEDHNIIGKQPEVAEKLKKELVKIMVE